MRFTRRISDGVASIVSLILWTSISAIVHGQEPDRRVEEEFGPTQDRSAETLAAEDSSLWRYLAPLALPPIDDIGLGKGSQTLIDLHLGPNFFSVARVDLADLRIFDAAGQPHPYALRYLRPASVREKVPASEFNRLEPEGGVHELTLELTPEVVQHNEIRIVTTGEAFRRPVEVDGSEDGEQWRRLVSGYLLRFADDDQEIDVDSLNYPDSRFRFVRFRIQPDPMPGEPAGGEDDFSIRHAEVLRTVDVPGERSEWEAIVGEREPTRIHGTPGSAWILDLQGQHVPCDRLDVDVAENEFVREAQLQVELPSGILERLSFQPIHLSEGSTWQRKPGEPARWMTVEFPEIQTSRLRLLVTDYQNAPLTIRSAKVSAAARQVVFPRPTPGSSELSLYAGNPLAESPRYDFARNLPERLDPAAQRIELPAPRQNPDFVPPPLPFTERFPWLIYMVLASVCVLLLAIIASLTRKAVALHDAEQQAPNQHNLDNQSGCGSTV